MIAPLKMQDLLGLRYIRARTWQVWLETIVITLCLPVVGWFVAPENPLFLHADFPWLVFAPLIVAARYGFFAGLISSLTLVLLLLAQHRLLAIPAAYPSQLALAMTLLAMIVGQFTDVWAKRLQRMQDYNDEIGLEYKKFANSYLQLKLSHLDLEERLAGRAATLRDATDGLQALMQKNADANEGLLASTGKDILNVLSTFAHIDQATLHLIEDHQLQTQPLARIGLSERQWTASHPMIQACLDTHQLVHLKHEDASTLLRFERQGILLVLPLVDLTDRLWGVVIVTEMPFISYEHENITKLAVLGAAVGEMARTDELESIQSASGKQITAFDRLKLRVESWVYFVREYRVEASLTLVRFSAPEMKDNEAMAATLSALIRSPDVSYTQRCNANTGDYCVWILMPLTNKKGATGFASRIKNEMERRELPHDFLSVTSREINATDTVDQLLSCAQ